MSELGGKTAERQKGKESGEHLGSVLESLQPMIESAQKKVWRRMRRQGLSGVHCPKLSALTARSGSNERVMEVTCGY